ncbi:UvrD-helicase domain-containing protein [Achromobacter sp. ACM03]|uniref:UvrD-helicase domain-containing protein n=1 Tax=Achromobacter sp. ACM03 TaxID=2769300 RepID=UPI0017836DD8|nr:UvrD-helicase domain-containing protein [Achromobacter sp. ACM03]MBD9430009.1 UvrD-helicase domain-containing protein [Achromobacter sp. ACM03]
MDQKNMNVEFVRAGAGSGKTYYLTHLLADRLQRGAARPAAIMATTFTVKAASELRERARSTLLSQRRLDLAAALGQASIGTVNSVCGQLIQRFCFELGISPDQTVLTEDEGRRLVRMAVESVQDANAVEHLARLAVRLDLDDDAVTATLHAIMNAARSNNLGPDELAAMGSDNADAMLACWPRPQGDHDAALGAALERTEGELKQAQAAGVTTKVLNEAIEKVTAARGALARGQLAWNVWQQLSKLKAGARQAGMVEELQDVAARHPTHERFHEDVRDYLRTVFGLAGRALQAFAQAKRELGVVDFTDQEVLLLRALQGSTLVREALEGELDLVLVDEFQDTNPLQLAIFVELAKLAKSSIWVGDPKQAIYGFRGTDSTLIQQILDSVESWGGTMGTPLSDSYRSTPALVGLANEVFVPAFHPAPASETALRPVRRPLVGQPQLLNWSFVTEAGKRSISLKALGPAVSDLLGRGIQFVDKTTGQARSLQASDIAVLCRKNDHIKSAVDALSRWGIAAAAARPGLISTPEVQLVLACLRRLRDASDTVATAMIVGLTGAVRPEDWLQDRLQFLAGMSTDGDGERSASESAWKTEGEGAHPLIARLAGLRSSLTSLTPREALRLAKAESGVARLAHQWSAAEREAQVRIANIEALLALAQQYEDACLGARQPATVNGMLLWFQELEANGADGRATAAHGAVEVMTFHAAKGLEWPMVIVIGLDHGYRTDLWSVRSRTIGAFDATAPLANRYIHHWVNPFGAGVQVIADAEASETGKLMAEQARAENTRLLYVALTRARDLLALVGGTKAAGDPPPCHWLDEIDAAAKLWGPAGEFVADGHTVVREAKSWDFDESLDAPPAPEVWAMRYFAARQRQSFQRLWFAPSAALPGQHRVITVEEVGRRIVVQSGTDMAALGSALHGCIACSMADPARAVSDEQIREALIRWGVHGAVTPEAVRFQVEAFQDWWQARWPGGVAQAELPIQVPRADGTVVRGQIDLLIRVPAGRILIDHKADPRGVDDGDRLAVTHGGQLEAYAGAVESASGEPVLERWLFLLVAARAVRIGAA